MYEYAETYFSYHIEPIDTHVYIRRYYDPWNAFSIHINNKKVWQSWPEAITIDGEGWAEAAFL